MAEVTTTARVAAKRGLDGRLLLCSLLRYSGAVALWERIVNRGRSLIVYYHNVHAPGDDISWCHEPSLSMPVELFRQQVEYLRRNFEVVSLEEAAAAASPRVVAITFDDGYRGVYDNAFPILREYRLPATVFLVTDFLGSRSGLWWDHLLDHLRAFRALPAADRAELAVRLPEPWAAMLVGESPEADILDCYKSADATCRWMVDEMLAAASAAPFVHHERIFLSVPEIQEMQVDGISFGAHSRTHPLLTWLNSGAMRDELSGSKQRVEAITGAGPCWFAYPDGTFTEREERAVEALGFTGAVQTSGLPGEWERYSMPRVGLKTASTTGRDGRLAPAKFRFVLAGMTRRRLWTTLSLRGHAVAAREP
jgi:peptidoglycan/xylan/chitin deacetylase (PgdA/CDA1 family)